MNFDYEKSRLIIVIDLAKAKVTWHLLRNFFLQ